MFHTSALLSSYPFLSELSAQFDALYEGWNTLFEQELALLRRQRAAEASVIVVDEALDFLCAAIAATILAESGGDRKSVTYQRYFGAARPSQLKRPVLGKQLDVMRSWIPSLSAADSSAALREYGQQLAERVAEADAAVIALAEAEREQADFEVGGRKRFIDDLNATRMRIHGEIAELAHRSTERRLSGNFPRRFFLRGRVAARTSINDLERKVLRARERLRRYEDQLARLIEDEERADDKRQDAEVEAAQAAMDELERQQAALAAQQAEISERLGELRGAAQ
ncbi:MAG: hypothetical protein Tsb0020_32430 [Haliangiales bacterium]